MTRLILLDLAPNPERGGAVVVVLLLIIIIGFILLLAAGLVVFLWYRKRSMRGVEMIRPDTSLTESAQPSKPNQP